MFTSILGDVQDSLVIVSDRELVLIKAVKSVFPMSMYLLCVWHIEKNAFSKSKQYFEQEKNFDAFVGAWNSVVYAENGSVFEKAWNDILSCYKEKKEALRYIEQTWLPYKDRFVSTWTEKCLHFGNRASSRAEGAHSKLKSYLQVSSSDFRKVKDRLCLAIDNEFAELKAKRCGDQIHDLHICQGSFFQEVRCRISSFAMKQLHMQYEMVQLGTMKSICSGQFTATMDLPCSHRMLEWKDDKLPLDVVHPQWRIDKNSFSHDSIITANQDEEFAQLFTALQDKYKQWSMTQREIARQKITLLLEAPYPLLLEPCTQKHKGGRKKPVAQHPAILQNLRSWLRKKDVELITV